MIGALTTGDISAMKAALQRVGVANSIAIMSREAYIDLRRSHDPFDIYKSRKMLRKVLPRVVVYRGDEWWH